MIEDVWFRVPKPRPQARLRMFAFHHAGGSASSYAKWSEQVPEDVELVLIELPGRGGRYREPFYTDFTKLTEDLGSRIARYLDRPFFFFGHSMGSLVAFQQVGWLEKHGYPKPIALVLSAFTAPTEERVRRRERIGDLDEAQLLEKLELFGEMPREVQKNDAYRRFYLDIIRSDIRLLESCDPSRVQRVSMPILALFSDQDPSVDFFGVQQWDQFTEAPVTIKVYPGDHFYLFNQSQDVIDYVFHFLDSESLIP